MARSRYSGRRRRSFKRKTPRSRIFRRRRRTYNKYDAGYAEKIVKMHHLTSVGAGSGRDQSDQFHAIAWYPYDHTVLNGLDPNLCSGPNLGTSGNQNSQWIQVNTCFRKYVPVGMKIKFTPVASNICEIGQIRMGTIMGASPIGPNYLNTVELNELGTARCLDGKEYNPRQTIKRYYKIAKHWKYSLSLREQDMNTVLATQPVTVLGIQGSGMAAGLPLGSLKITWYYKFKNRQL